MARVGSSGNRKVGKVYGHLTHRGLVRDLYDYECTIAPKGVEAGRCCHRCCRLAALCAAGHEQVAKRLEANSVARDWLRNWGKMVYDPQIHGKNAKRRALAAKLARALRDGADVVDVIRGGCWAGALVDCQKIEE